MSDQVNVEIPIEQFDLSLLPENARQLGTQPFRDAVVGFFQSELKAVADWIQVVVDERIIHVAWRSKSDGFDPVEHAIDHLKAGDYPRGVQVLRLLTKARPNDVAINYNLGMALSDLGQLDAAVEHLRRAMDNEPNQVNIQVALGVALYRMQDMSAARIVLEKAVDLEPDNPYALRNLAGCLLALNEPAAKATEYLLRSTALLPEDQQGWVGLGQALEKEGRIAESDKAFIRAIDINPHNSIAEAAKTGRSRIAQRTMRENAGGGLRMDAVMYCLGALEKCKTMARAEVQKIAFEIATEGTKGINPNDINKKHRLRCLPGEFTGLHLLCWMYVTWKIIEPKMDTGFDLSKEYEAALVLLKKTD